MKVYTIERNVICSLVGQICDSPIPDCKNCDTYIQYKKSDQTIKQFCKENKF